ncbi:MAG: flagellar filament capping protein FliD [Thermoguttaceae bacterium]|jgi:flagellar hook-associated protein 2
MGRIQATTGLVSGIDFSSTISQLMAIDDEPMNALTADNTTLTNQQTSINQLAALLLSVQSVTQTLGQTSTYQQQTATSSDPGALTATVTGNPAVGAYQYTPLQSVQTQQFLSSGFQSQTSSLGAGTLTFRFGPGVDQGVSLDELNGGQGFSRGKIQITDRSGATATIDLRTAQNIDDVLSAINNAGTINVTAVAQDDHIELIDHTGNTGTDAPPLKVQEVGGGTTAASLGLTNLTATDNTASGTPILDLAGNFALSALNDGAGISTSNVLPDIEYTLRNGTSGTIDFTGSETTLGQIMQEISTQSNGNLQVSIASGGKGLKVTDESTPQNSNSTFSISDATGSAAASSLGLVGSTTGASITGSAILGGLKTVLLSSLNGGQGLGTLGDLVLTDRNNKPVTVNLAGFQTLDQVIGQINTETAKAGVAVTASVNQADDGIQLTDTSGLATGNLVAADGSDGTTTATKLGIDTTSASGTIQGADLHRQTVSRNTALADLNGGAGVAKGTIIINGSAGEGITVDLSGQSTQTVGDVIDAINRAAIGSSSGIHAEINATGDGIAIQDTAGGTGKLSVTEGTSTTAHDLHLLTAESTAGSVQTVDGTTTQKVKLTSTANTLTDLQNEINQLGGGLSASILDDGSSHPYRLILTSSQAGKSGNLVVDASQLSGLAIQETAQGQDALMALGGGTNLAAATLVASSTGQFQSVLPGVNLSIQNATGQAVTVNVATSDSNIASNIQTLVTNYNSFRSQLTQDTAYDASTNTPAVLTTDPTTTQLDIQLSNLLSSRFLSSGSVQSLADLGITLQNDGTLSFNQTTFDSAYSADPGAVQQFFTTAKSGFSAQIDNLVNQLAGQGNSLLSARVTALQQQVTDNTQRISEMKSMLNDEQNRLYEEFDNMEAAISNLKNIQNVVTAITPLDPWVGDQTTSGMA